MKNSLSIIVKGADKVSVAVVWERRDYLKEAYRQLNDKEVFEQVPNDSSVLGNALMKALEKRRLRSDLSKGILDYFMVRDPKVTRFYLATT